MCAFNLTGRLEFIGLKYLHNFTEFIDGAALICIIFHHLRKFIFIIFLIRWRMNLLTLPDSEARALGENTALLRVITIICSTMLTAASISVAGGVSWVGLIVPHIARLLVGDDFKKVLPTAALFGGIYLLIMDDLSRGLIATGIPIGILTSIVGAPLFFVILIRNRRAIVSDD